MCEDDAYLLAVLDLEPVLRAYLRRFASSKADVEDLVQESYVKLLAVPEVERPQIGSVRAFAVATARNLALDLARRRQIVPIDFLADMESAALEASGGNVEDIVSSHQELQAAEVAMATLPERCREVFSLRKVFGFSQKEIARRLGISENTVERHLVKGVRLFTKAYAAPDSEPARGRPTLLGSLLGPRRGQGDA